MFEHHFFHITKEKIFHLQEDRLYALFPIPPPKNNWKIWKVIYKPNISRLWKVERRQQTGSDLRNNTEESSLGFLFALYTLDLVLKKPESQNASGADQKEKSQQKSVLYSHRSRKEQRFWKRLPSNCPTPDKYQEKKKNLCGIIPTHASVVVSGEPRFPPSPSCNGVATQGVVREGQIGSRDFHLHWVAMSFSSYSLLGCVRESPVKSQLFHHNTALMMTTPSVAVGHAGRNEGISVSPSQDGISGGLVGSHNFHLLPVKMKNPYCLRLSVDFKRRTWTATLPGSNKVTPSPLSTSSK